VEEEDIVKVRRVDEADAMESEEKMEKEDIVTCRYL
jgi:hypothetical protein